MAEFKTDERIYETSSTTGTGEYTLGGAVTSFQAVSVISANNYGPFFITDDTNWEVVIGTYVSGPDRLQRTAVLASSNGGAAVNWGVGSKKIRCGWPAWLAQPRRTAKSVAGSANVTLTASEQRCHLLELTGVLTGNIEVYVDVTKWLWLVKNSTTGNYTVTLKTASGTGIKLPQGPALPAYCDGTNVVSGAAALFEKTTVASATTPDIWTATGPLIDYTGTTAATGFAQAPHAGARRTLLCAGACSFTAGANLLTPGSANITAAAGDLVTVHAVTTTQFRLEITRASGQAVVPGLAVNLVINDSGAVNQDADTAAAADDTYGHDQWYRLTQSNAIAVSDVSNAENGTPNMMRLTQSNAAAQRMGYAQIIEGKNCKHLRGQAVKFKFGRVRQSTSANIRIAVLEWTGTEDAVTSDVVNDWTSATYTAGNFFLGSNLTVSSVVQQALTANTLTDGSEISVTLGSSFNNLIVFVWTEATVAQNVTLDLAKAQLDTGGIYAPRPYADNLRICHRYYRKQRASASNNLACSGTGYITNSQQVFADPFPVPMRGVPTFAVSAASDFYILVNGSTAAATSLALTAADPQSAMLQTANTSFGATAGAILAAANGNAWKAYNARL